MKLNNSNDGATYIYPYSNKDNESIINQSTGKQATSKMKCNDTAVYLIREEVTLIHKKTSKLNCTIPLEPTLLPILKIDGL